MNHTSRRTFSFAVIIALLVFAPIAAAQTVGARFPAPSGQSRIEPNDYGVSSADYLMIPGSSFVPSDSTTGYIKPYLFLTRTGGGSSEFTHALILPSGAFLQTITAYVVDSSAAQDVTLRLCELYADPNTGLNQGLDCPTDPGVHTTGAPGQTSLVLSVNQTLKPIDPFGQEGSWIILVHLGATDSTTQLNTVRVAWKRQMSPDPAGATFTDVPFGHPFHRFVEALVAAGITGGCGGGNYCPDAPVTRGQIAVFLSAALGLHWAP